MDPRTTTSTRADRRGKPRSRRRPALLLGTAVAGAVLANALIGVEPAAQAEAGASESVSVAAELGLSAQSAPARVDAAPDLQPLEDLAASRASREAEQTAAQQAQAAADQAARDRQQAEAEAAARAAAEAEAAARAAAEAEAAAAAEQAAPAAAAAPARAAAPGAVARITNTAGSIKPAAQAAANAVVSNVPGAADITLGGTRASAADPHGHPSGLAVDYMVLTDAALGDAIVQYHRDHWAELGVEYLIWEQRILQSPNGSFEPMADRGGVTANHFDHVHVNYRG
ncbi:hypothetical protein ACI789_16605 [Geodermatophilus sp. SYSU D00965]